MKKILLSIFIIFHITYPFEDEVSIDSNKNNQEQKNILEQQEDQKFVQKKASLQRAYDRLKTTHSTKYTDFNIDNFKEEMNALSEKRIAEDTARTKMLDAENRIAANRRNQQHLGERTFLGTSADIGIDQEEQLARNKDILDINKQRLFEDLKLKAQHFEAFKTKYSEFAKKQPWNTLLELGNMPKFMNDSLDTRNAFLEQIKEINLDTINLDTIDDNDLAALQDLKALTQLYTRTSTPNPSATNSSEIEMTEKTADNSLQQDLSKMTDTEKEGLKNNLKKFLQKTIDRSHAELTTFSNNLETIKKDLATKLAAIKTVKTAANNATMILAGVAVSCLVDKVESVFACMHMTMETFGLTAKGTFLVAHGAEHAEMDAIKQLQDSFVTTFQPLLPETTKLIQSLEYTSAATSLATRTQQAIQFRSTDLTQELMNSSNVNGPKFQEDLENLQKELQNSTTILRGKRIDQLLTIVNKNSKSAAAQKITAMLTDQNNNLLGENDSLQIAEDGTLTYTSELSKNISKVTDTIHNVTNTIHNKTSFQSTLLAEELMNNFDIAKLDELRTELKNSSAFLLSARIKSILDVMNKNINNTHTEEIKEKLNQILIESNANLQISKDLNTNRWIIESTKRKDKTPSFLTKIGSKTKSLKDWITTKLSSNKSKEDTFKEFQLAGQDSGLTDDQIEAHYNKELKRIELEQEKNKANQENKTSSLDFKEFARSDALKQQQRNLEDAARTDFWKNKDKNYAAIRNERGGSESFIKKLVTDTAADHERTDIRNQYILETNIARMHEDFATRKERFEQFKNTYPDFSKKDPWAKLIALNDMNDFINMSYEQRSSLLNEVDKAIEEFLKSSIINTNDISIINTNDIKALTDFIQLNNLYLGNLPSDINTALQEDVTHVITNAQEKFKGEVTKFLKTTIQASLTALHTFNEEMKDIQGKITSLDAMNKVKNVSYSAVMASGAVGVAAFLTHAHVVFEAAAVVGKISLITSHIYTEKTAHLSQEIQDNYVDTFSKLLPKSTELIKTQIHINRGKNIFDFDSTKLVKDLMNLDPTKNQTDFNEKLEELTADLNTNYKKWYKNKRIESLLEIINSDPESPAALKIIESLQSTDKPILEDHLILKENRKWVLTSSKSLTALRKFLELGDTKKQDAQFDKLTSSLQDELSQLSPALRIEHIKKILDILNSPVGKNLDDVRNISNIDKIDKIVQFLNAATDEPTSLITKAKKSLNNFFNFKEAKPERFLLGDDEIIKTTESPKFTLQERPTVTQVKKLMNMNSADPEFEKNLTTLTGELKELSSSPDQINVLLDIINKTPNSLSAKKIIERLNTIDNDYAIKKENGKLIIVSKKSIIPTNEISNPTNNSTALPQNIEQQLNTILKSNQTTNDLNFSTLKELNNNLTELLPIERTQVIQTILQKITDGLKKQTLSEQQAKNIVESLNIWALKDTDMIIGAHNNRLALIPKQTSNLSLNPTKISVTPNISTTPTTP